MEKIQKGSVLRLIPTYPILKLAAFRLCFLFLFFQMVNATFQTRYLSFGQTVKEHFAHVNDKQLVYQSWSNDRGL